MFYRVEPFAESDSGRPHASLVEAASLRGRFERERRLLLDLGLSSGLVGVAASEARRLGVTTDAAQLIVMPPSITSVWPVRKLAASLAR